MKRMKLYRVALLALLLGGGLTACNDDTTPVYDFQAAPALEPLNNSDFVLNEEAAPFVAQVFSWTKGKFGFAAAPTYTLQIDETDRFPDPVILAEATRTYAPVTVGRLNVASLILGAAESDPKDLYVRVEARLTPSVAVWSDPIQVTVAPYDQVIVYPVLYMPGSYQGWDPASSAQLTSWRLNNKFEGEVNLVDAGNPQAAIVFKLITKPAWGSGIEYGSGGAPGMLKEGGGDIAISPQGKYRIVVDLNTMTYTATLLEP